MSIERGYNKALATSKRRLQAELRLGEWLNTHQKLLNDLWRRAQQATEGDNLSSTYIDSTPAYWSPEYASQDHLVSILITARNLEGLKDPRLEKLITPFLDAPESRSADYPAAMNRDYTFSYPAGEGKVTVSIAAYVKEENPTCRKILVERKTVTTLQEVYKLACDGDIIDADPVLPKLETPAADPNVIDA